MCIAVFKQARWMRDNQSAAQDAYNSGASDYQGYKFFDQSNPRKSIYDKGFTMLAPGRDGLASPSVVNPDGSKTFGSSKGITPGLGVSSIFNPVAPQGSATRVIS